MKLSDGIKLMQKALDDEDKFLKEAIKNQPDAIQLQREEEDYDAILTKSKH